MPKTGSAKNTKNKAKHSKLMSKKKNKLRKEKLSRKQKLRDIIERAKKSANEEE
ncbi:hypothetical protein [Lacinutrix venerupis]|uniref:hypothetical protein n=1 Tax=Lacinutrix venerupis TaxID=1486034 RepID=UPI0018DE666D|nr:hypothetical protein [Lacinutrix venerupis]